MNTQFSKASKQASARRQALTKMTAVAVAMASAGLLAACAKPARRVTYAGATTLIPTLAALAPRFEAAHPGTRLVLTGGGSTKGILDAISGAAHLGGVVRDMSEQERAAVHQVPVALDGIAIIVHDDGDIQEISIRELRRIYTGAPGVPLAGKPILRVGKSAVHGTFQNMAKSLGVPESAMQADIVAGSNGEVLTLVAARPGSIGYVSAADAGQAVQHGARIRILRVDGVAPTQEAIASKAYPLAVTVMVVLPKRNVTYETLMLVAMLRSQHGIAALRANGLVPLATVAAKEAP